MTTARRAAGETWRLPRRAVGSELLFALGPVLLAAAVRLPTLAQQSLWLDEGYTQHLVRMSFGAMLRGVSRSESTPPLYYVLAWVWTHAFGSSAFAIRSLSALAGIACTLVVYAIADRLAGRRAALITATLVALSPLMVWYSQEARAYALAALLSATTVLCFVGFLVDGKSRSLALWAVAAALGLATHYFVAFVVAPEALWLLWRDRDQRRVLAALAAVLAVTVALVPLAVSQEGSGHADYIAQGSLATRVAQVPKQLLIGYASPGQLVTGVLAAALVLCGALWPLLSDLEARRRAAAPLAIGVFAVAVPIVLALVGIDFLNTRNLLAALPPLFVVLGIGFAVQRTWPWGGLAAAALALIFAAVIALVVTHPRYQRDNWRGASGALGAPSGERVLVITPGSGQIPLTAYQAGLSSLRGPTVARELDVVALPAHATGAGLSAPPRPRPGQRPPAGFRLTGATYASTYTVLHYRSVLPRPITVRAAAASALASDPALVSQR